jgi:hypothetical protein
VKKLIALAGVAITVAALLFGIDFYRHRFVRHNSEIVRLLPPGEFNLIYADIEILRRADLLGLLSNIKVAPDKEYDSFIEQTNFDYTRDLDAVAIAIDPDQTWLIGRGRFSWEKLRAFALSHQGTCNLELGGCRVAASTPGRWVIFVSLQPDVLGVVISSNRTPDLRPPGRRSLQDLPDAPVWAKLSHALLAKPVGLPLPMQVFAISMQSADSVALSAHPDNLQLKARFANPATADTARHQLEIQTKTLTNSGSLSVIGTDLVGRWPISPELLKKLQ